MELMASDTYEIYSKGQLHVEHYRLLQLLYQPILGREAVTLYQILWAEIPHNTHLTTSNTHYRLTLLTSLDIDKISLEREKLEGIGLLNTFIKEEGDHYQYLYELLLPLDADAFFANDLLNVLLYKALGELDYSKTKYHFQVPTILKKKYQEITKNFSEVFNIDLDKNSLKKTVLQKKVNLSQSKRKHIVLNYHMELFYTGLREFQIKRKSITKEIEELIIQLGTVYDISPLEMRSLVKQSITNDIVDAEALRSFAKRYYEFEADGNFIKVHEQQPTRYKVVKGNDARSNKISQLESFTPYQMLKSLQGNHSEPSLRDLNVVESLMTRQKLEPGVVNVIIELVIMLNKGALPRAHVEALGGSFARKKIKTVEQALEESKSYLRKLQNEDQEDLRVEWKEKKKEEKVVKQKAVVNEQVDEESIKAMLSNLYEG